MKDYSASLNEFFTILLVSILRDVFGKTDYHFFDLRVLYNAFNYQENNQIYPVKGSDQT